MGEVGSRVIIRRFVGVWRIVDAESDLTLHLCLSLDACKEECDRQGWRVVRVEELQEGGDGGRCGAVGGPPADLLGAHGGWVPRMEGAGWRERAVVSDGG